MTGLDPVLRALAHPLRLRMMTLMWPGPMSAAELARELDISHALASGHLRRLDAVGLVELAEERTKRGGRERRYRAVHGSPLSEQREGALMLAGTLTHTLRERAARRAPSGEGVTADAELWVDPEVWEDVRRRLADLTMELHEAARPPRSEGTSRVGLTVMAFPMREDGDQDRDQDGDQDEDPGETAEQDRGDRGVRSRGRGKGGTGLESGRRKDRTT